MHYLLYCKLGARPGNKAILLRNYLHLIAWFYAEQRTEYICAVCFTALPPSNKVTLHEWWFDDSGGVGGGACVRMMRFYPHTFALKNNIGVSLTCPLNLKLGSQKHRQTNKSACLWMCSSFYYLFQSWLLQTIPNLFTIFLNFKLLFRISQFCYLDSKYHILSDYIITVTAGIHL